MKLVATAITVITLMILTGCSSENQCMNSLPTVEHSKDVSLTSYKVTASDSTCLQAYEWKPLSIPIRSAVVIVHGVRDHATRYSVLAESLNAAGCVVYAQDHRGHGNSGGDRQRFESIPQLVEDVRLAVMEAKKRNPNIPVYMFGHSLGGLTAATYAVTHQDELSGVILSGALLKLPPFVNGFQTGAARFFGFLIPGLRIQAIDDQEFVRDSVAKADLAGDPLIDHSNLPARSAAAGLNGLDEIQKRMEEITLPLLILHGKEDKSTNNEGSKELYTRAKSIDKTLHLYEKMQHDLMHEPERNEVMHDITIWIISHRDTNIK